MRAAILYAVLAIGCASGAPRAGVDGDPVTLRGGVVPARVQMATLTFSARPIHCVRECMVTLKAVVEAPPDLCVTGVKWTFDDGRWGGEQGSDGPVKAECTERHFSALRRYKPGRHYAKVEILSDSTTLPAGIEIDVEERRE